MSGGAASHERPPFLHPLNSPLLYYTRDQLRGRSVAPHLSTARKFSVVIARSILEGIEPSPARKAVLIPALRTWRQAHDIEEGRVGQKHHEVVRPYNDGLYQAPVSTSPPSLACCNRLWGLYRVSLPFAASSLGAVSRSQLTNGPTQRRRGDTSRGSKTDMPPIVAASPVA